MKRDEIVLQKFGFEKYFAEMSEALRGDGTPDVEKIGEIASRYGLIDEWDRIPELVRKYKLTPPR